MATHESYMERCLQLAACGMGYTAPNPIVGAVLVHNGLIIGEGFHQRYGEAHAEVNCINNVREEDLGKIPKSTLYVSLEPCAHYGQTPPCADLIISKKIPHVVIGCRDPFKEVDGKGMEKLIRAGLRVESGILERECRELNRRFFIYVTASRPYVLLKWAQTNDGFIANKDHSRIFISNEFTNRLVHKWRSEEAAILIGTNTALDDNPSLTVRHWTGTQPLRVILDMNLRLPTHLKVFETESPLIVFNSKKEGDENHIQFRMLDSNLPLIPQMMQELMALKVQSLIVEGGKILLQSFIDSGIWDEARVIQNKFLFAGDG
ncbi:MAG: bifunctional diaminohydroxyphosphoribosylaminopyrimidine deaminase/5-amino-6-(5-phosphoribosylamino)uracil reductase RibD, partial [Chitinophagales bacterium]